MENSQNQSGIFGIPFVNLGAVAAFETAAYVGGVATDLAKGAAGPKLDATLFTIQVTTDGLAHFGSERVISGGFGKSAGVEFVATLSATAAGAGFIPAALTGFAAGFVYTEINTLIENMSWDGIFDPVGDASAELQAEHPYLSNSKARAIVEDAVSQQQNSMPWTTLLGSPQEAVELYGDPTNIAHNTPSPTPPLTGPAGMSDAPGRPLPPPLPVVTNPGGGSSGGGSNGPAGGPIPPSNGGSGSHSGGSGSSGSGSSGSSSGGTGNFFKNIFDLLTGGSSGSAQLGEKLWMRSSQKIFGVKLHSVQWR